MQIRGLYGLPAELVQWTESGALRVLKLVRALDRHLAATNDTDLDAERTLVATLRSTLARHASKPDLAGLSPRDPVTGLPPPLVRALG